jgi:SAM-dependent methyltransferase
VRPFWHPLSTILLSDPRCFATEGLVRMLLATERRAEMIYGGDRMWPTMRHGARFTVEPLRDDSLSTGEIILVSRDGIPDLLRVAGAGEADVTLTADAEPAAPVVLPREAVFGRARLPSSAAGGRRGASLRRFALDLREAWSGRPDPREDPAGTVRDKYESQATYYARAGGADLDAGLLARVRERVSPKGRVLVVGSGVGRECFALAAAGWRVLGVEFAPAMIGLSRKRAADRGLDVDFRLADIREHVLDHASLDGIFFTYDVYSFLPHRRERIALLRRLRSWLRPGGVVFLSARRVLSRYDRLILSLQWLALSRTGEAEWGDSHTRWIPNDGELHRSFIHVFSTRQLRAETTAAGFDMGRWDEGHCVLAPWSAAMIRT